MCYAVIDTNVLVSALYAKRVSSATVIILDKIFSGEIIPLFNADIIKEYTDVLNRSKFGFDAKNVETLIAKIQDFGKQVDRMPFEGSMIDEDDRVFYEVSLAEDESFLVTGNLKHFPKVPKVVTPAEMLVILKNLH